MKCNKCGNENPDDAKFCSVCYEVFKHVNADSKEDQEAKKAPASAYVKPAEPVKGELLAEAMFKLEKIKQEQKEKLTKKEPFLKLDKKSIIRLVIFVILGLIMLFFTLMRMKQAQRILNQSKRTGDISLAC